MQTQPFHPPSLPPLVLPQLEKQHPQVRMGCYESSLIVSLHILSTLYRTVHGAPFHSLTKRSLTTHFQAGRGQGKASFPLPWTAQGPEDQGQLCATPEDTPLIP